MTIKQIKATKTGFYTMENRELLSEALETIQPIQKETFIKLLKSGIYEFYAYDERIEANRYILQDIEHNYGLPVWLIQKGNEKPNEKANYNNSYHAIVLEWNIWQEIASACISVADFNKLNEHNKEALRKTYFTIKAMTR